MNKRKKSGGFLRKYENLKQKVIVFAIGILVIIASFVFGKNPDKLEALNTIGTTLITTSILNIFWEKFANNKIDKMQQASIIALDLLDTKNNIRYKQVVEILFKKNESEDKIIAKITHSFTYNEESKAGQKCKIEIFSDFRGKVFNKDELEQPETTPPFYFKRIERNDEPIAEWKNISHREKLCFVQYGKLCYSEDILFPLEPNEFGERFKFHIINTYSTNDRLFWTFQEMAHGGIKLIVTKDKSAKDINFYIRINHPKVEDILNKDINKDTIAKETGKMKTESIKIEIDKSVFPYQGFEISWDSNEPNKNNCNQQIESPTASSS